MYVCILRNPLTAWKVSKYSVFSGPYFPHSDWIRRDTPYLSVFSPNAGNTDQKKLCIWTLFTQWLPVRRLANSYSTESLTIEVFINNKRCYVASWYRSPSQTSDESDSFIANLEEILINTSRNNPCFVLIISYFNAKSSNWSSNDTITAGVTQLDYLTSLYGMKQVVTEPIHILESSASCRDLILPSSLTLL